MLVPEELLAFAVSADSRRRCISLPSLCGFLRVFRFFRDLGSNALPAVAEAVAVAVHLQDVDVVGEPVEYRSGQSLRPETSVDSSKGRLVVTKLKPRWDVHLSGDDDQPGCAGEFLSSVLGE